jgi:DNA polymerase III subunit delta'
VKARDSEAEFEPPHPRQTTVLFGHAAAEQTLLASYRSGRTAHAWLIGGAQGIGKATLAYRMARFVLAHPDPDVQAVQEARSLAVPEDHVVSRRIAARSHSDLLSLERTAGDSGQLRTVITVEDVRRTVGFYGSTAGEGGWRVCVVDSADELKYPEASNALLKVLEEPPPRSLFFVVSHAPGRLLPTIRSRCRRLMLRPLAAQDVARAAAEALGRDATTDDIAAAAAADGSVARALALLSGEQLAVRERVMGLLQRLPLTDAQELHALGDSLERADNATLATFVDTVRDWLSAQIREPSPDTRRLAQVSEVWEKLNRSARDVEVFNLERKPMVFAVFGSLAQAGLRSPTSNGG